MTRCGKQPGKEFRGLDICRYLDYGYTFRPGTELDARKRLIVATGHRRDINALDLVNQKGAAPLTRTLVITETNQLHAAI